LEKVSHATTLATGKSVSCNYTATREKIVATTTEKFSVETTLATEENFSCNHT
jgi:hypothetical protein